MVKTESKGNNGFPLVSLLKQNSVDAINEFLKKSGLGTQYTKRIVGKNTRVIRIRSKFKFWDRLMREKPGFNKGNNDIR